MIALLSPSEFDAAVPELSDILHACVAQGASVNFVWPFGLNQAEAYWRTKVQLPHEQGLRLVFVARLGRRICATVQLDLDTPPNQPHRADVAKLLVHPEARRRGLARKLLSVLEFEALARGRRLLTLDTVPTDVAFSLYRTTGYQVAGEIPGFALSPDGQSKDATCYLYKEMGQ